MGNKLGRRRQMVDEKYTRPQGLYQHKDVDQKKLRKLILDSKLAPCYPGDDDVACDLEECPICFLYYPSLNRSRCCMKGICTECFLQMKTPNSTRPTQCPFCKTSNYAVEYRGVKSKQEKSLEQVEEQRVIEAKIRMRQKELQDDEERMLKRTENSASSSMRRPSGIDYCSTAAHSIASTAESEEMVSSHVPTAASAIRPPSRQRPNRDENFDLDLEDIMVMEAIWLSIQENDKSNDPSYNDNAQLDEYMTEEHFNSAASVTSQVAGSSSSPSSGLACAIAALAERQQTSGDTSNNYSRELSRYNQDEHEHGTYFPADTAIMRGDNNGHWVDHRSEMAEAGTSYHGSDDFDNAATMRPSSQQDVDNPSDFGQPIGGSIVPESFEEQMMLAMAVSLAEARPRNSAPGLAWH